MKRFGSHTGGGVALATAILLPALIGAAGLAIDIGYWYTVKRSMQTAADAGAIEAAASYSAGNTTGYVARAQAVVAANGWPNGGVSAGSKISVAVNTPPKYGNHTANSYQNQAFEIVISRPQPPIMAWAAGFSANTTVSAHSVALVYGNFCVLTNSAQLSGGSQLAFSNCGMGAMATSANCLQLSGGSLISASIVAIGCAAVNLSGGSQIKAPIKYQQAAITDPYASRTIPNFSGCNHTNVNYQTSQTISQGVYCQGFQVQGNTTVVTMNPGIYILDSATLNLSGGATLKGSNVTIILTTSSSNFGMTGAVNISGASNLEISAPLTGATTGIALWIDGRAPTQTQNISGGSNFQITGAIYMPSQSVNYSGGSTTPSGCTQLVAQSATFSGGSGFGDNCVGTGVTNIVGPGSTISMVE